MARLVISDWPRLSVSVGKHRIGLGAGQIGFGLHDLLVEIGRVDFGEEVAGFDRRADIGLPIFHIAGDARINLRLRVGFQPARQAEGCGLAAGIRRRHGNDRHCLSFGPFLQLGVGDLARRDTGDDDDHDRRSPQ